MLEEKLPKVQDQDFMLGKSGVFKLSLLVFIINLFKENLKVSKPSNDININIKEHPSSQGGKMTKCLVRWEHRLYGQNLSEMTLLF